MNIETARQMFGIENENAKVFFAQIPRCVILDRSIPFAAKNIYYYLIARCDHNQGPFTWVSQKTISEDMQISRENVNRQIKVLERLRLIEIRKTAENRNVYSIKDVTALYGDFATAPWKTKKNVGGSCDEIVTTPVTKSSLPPCDEIVTTPVTKSSHKEEEAKNKKSEEQEGKNDCRAGAATPKIPVASNVKMSDWEESDEFAQLFENLNKLPASQRQFNREKYRSWLKELMQQQATTIAKLIELAEEWQAYHNASGGKKPTKISMSFGNWVKNHFAWGKDNNGYSQRIPEKQRMGEQGYAPFDDEFLARLNEVPI